MREDQAAVGAAEPEGVREYVGDLRLPGSTDDVIELAVRVDFRRSVAEPQWGRGLFRPRQ